MMWNRTALLVWFLALFYFFFYLSSNTSLTQELVSSEAVIGEVDGLPFVTLYSTKSAGMISNKSDWSLK